MSTPILRWTARALTPVIVGFSIYFLLRGHNAPGGGFIAALVAGSAVVLQYLANGLEGIRRFVPVRFATLMAFGLVIAVLAGIIPLFFGGAFLQGAVWYLGDLKVAASLGFDVGVYLVVLSVVIVIVRYLGERP